MNIFINLELDPYNETYRFDNHRWVAYMESIGKAMACDPESELSLTFTDNATLQHLNAEYREIDRPTDVLAFPQDLINHLLGDVVISIEKAAEQAKDKGHSLEYELALLATHGFLHLMGYDHAEPEEEAEMFGLQQELLDAHYAECFSSVVQVEPAPEGA